MDSRKRSRSAHKVDFKSWRDFTPMNTSVGTMLHNLTGTWRYVKPCYEDKTPACQNACPAGNDIEAFIKLIQKGDYENACRHLKCEEPFPAVLGRVCFGFCEAACNRRVLDEGISIRELERFVGDHGSPALRFPEPAEEHGKTLAVVGSGPAGMSAAYFARLLGFRVTVFEKEPEMGGILRLGIPAYRLPREVVAREFEGLRAMGIRLIPGTAVGSDIPIERILKEHDYVFLGTGVHASLPLNLAPGAPGPGILSGLELLRKTALNEPVDAGPRVVVVGGGNTAVDAARTLVRLGNEVTVLYRRTMDEMPAHHEEVRDAQEEGLTFRFLASPAGLLLYENGRIRCVLCREMELGPPDRSGRPGPVESDRTFELEADTVVSAIGEAPLFDYLGGRLPAENGVLAVGDDLRVHKIEETPAVVYAGGDIIDIPHTVVHAVAAGKRAALAMDCDRLGIAWPEVLEEIRTGDGGALSFSRYRGLPPLNPVRMNLRKVVRHEDMVTDYFMEAPRVPANRSEADDRRNSFAPVSRTFTPDQALDEANRCLHCGRCTECNNCLVFCPDLCVLPRGDGRFGYEVDYDYCKGCGICSVECPRNAVTMVDEETPVDLYNLITPINENFP